MAWSGVGRSGVVVFPRTLQTNAGRKKILACMQQRLPITRPVGESSGLAGVPECQTVLDEMAAVKAGTTPGGLSPAQAQADLSAERPADVPAEAEDSQKTQEQQEEQLGADECSP